MFAIICPLLRKTSLGIGSGEVEYTTNILGANLGAFALGLARSAKLAHKLSKLLVHTFEDLT